MNSLPPELNTPESKPEKVDTLIKRFGVGAITGIIVAAFYWSYKTNNLGYAEPITTGIIGTLLLAIFFGLMSLKWGYKILESLVERLP